MLIKRPKFILMTCALLIHLALSGAELTKVELYSSGTGKFVREREVQLNGNATEVVWRNLPGNIDGNSLKANVVGGDEVWVEELSFRTLNGAELNKPEAVKIAEKAVYQLEDKIQELKGNVAIREQQLKYEQDFLDALYKGISAGKEINQEVISEKIRSLVEFQEDLRTVRSQTDTELRKLNEQLKEAQGKLQEARNQMYKLNGEVRFVLKGKQTGTSTVELSGLFNGANWRPVYDFSASLKDRTVEVAYGAMINNQTGEDWMQIDLLLLTGNVNRGTEAPEIQPLYLDEPRQYEPPPPMYSSRSKAMADQVYEMSAMAASEKPEMEAESIGVQVGIRSSQPVSVAAGKGEQKVELFEDTLPAEFWSQTAPLLVETAYLHGSFENNLTVPIIPGNVTLRVDGAYTGNGYVDFTNIGETVKTGFGENPQIIVKRKSIVRKTAEKGLFDKVRVVERDFVTTIRNTLPFEHQVIVKDRFPLAKHEEIKVKRMSPDDVKVDEETGVFEVSRSLKAGEEMSLETRFQVEMPRDWKIEM